MSVVVPDWPAPPNVRAFVTTKAEGDMARGYAARKALAVPAAPRWLRQVHGAAVIEADAIGEGAEEPVADGAIARRRGTVCSVTVADCMPVLLTDRSGSVVSVAHAGWRGLCAGVLEAAAEAMRARELMAWMGPAIGPAVYEVGEEVREAFVSRDTGASDAFRASARPGHWLLDLYAVARRRLRASGVESIHGGGFCTYTDTERFFSYRRDRTACRMAAAIWLA